MSSSAVDTPLNRFVRSVQDINPAPATPPALQTPPPPPVPPSVAERLVAVQQAAAAAAAVPSPPTPPAAVVAPSPPPAPMVPMATSTQGFWSRLSDFLMRHGLVIGGSCAVFVVVLIGLYMWQSKSSSDDKKKH